MVVDDDSPVPRRTGNNGNVIFPGNLSLRLETCDIGLCSISRTVSDRYGKTGGKITTSTTSFSLFTQASDAADESNAARGKMKQNRTAEISLLWSRFCGI